MPRNATEFQENLITEFKTWRDISITHSSPFERLVEYLKKYPVCRNGDPYSPENIERLKNLAKEDTHLFQTLVSNFEDSYVEEKDGYEFLHVPSFSRYKAGEGF